MRKQQPETDEAASGHWWNPRNRSRAPTQVTDVTDWTSGPADQVSGRYPSRLLFNGVSDGKLSESLLSSPFSAALPFLHFDLGVYVRDFEYIVSTRLHW